ncbi:MAG: glucosamine-6-phosphate deaminase [Rhodothermales bacterium]|nr:glucosamine-6-phosphate deaminase [Rhodothermales bacterium]
MQLTLSSDKRACGMAAAEAGARLLRAALDRAGHATIVLATGASQFEMLAHLASLPDIAWQRVTAFHLDEYAGLPISHPASFRRYLWERFVRILPLPLRAIHYIDAEIDATAEAMRLSELIAGHRVDVGFVGIGENGHLAFNDPPADFETTAPYLVATLDEACRRQQLGEGWFATLGDVPRTAVSMSVHRIMASEAIICTVPEARKAHAVRGAVEGPVTPAVPASILQRHPQCGIFLDGEAAARLSR